MTKASRSLSVIPLRNKVREVRAELAHKIAAFVGSQERVVTDIPGLSLYRRTAPSGPCPVTYQPSLAVMAQGRKRIDLSGTSMIFDESRYLLTSIDLPVVSRLIEASPERPSLTMLLKLEMNMVRELLSQHEIQVADAPSSGPAIVVGEVTVELLEACCRLLDLLWSPQDIPVLSGLIQREIIYRILRGPAGARLRAIATLGDQSQRMAKAIAWLKANYAKPLRVEALARIAGMGLSTFHHHFRALTAMSPLQYQKQLRLHAARQRMLVEDLDAASAAFEVGYQSPSQFSREYKRFFGRPPAQDVHALRQQGVSRLDVAIYRRKSA